VANVPVHPAEKPGVPLNPPGDLPKEKKRMVQHPNLLRRAEPSSSKSTTHRYLLGGVPMSGPSVPALATHKACPPWIHPTPKQHHSARTSLYRRGTRLGYATAPAGRETHHNERGCLSPAATPYPKAPRHNNDEEKGSIPTRSGFRRPRRDDDNQHRMNTNPG
jgi:hypothetical protein